MELGSLRGAGKDKDFTYGTGRINTQPPQQDEMTYAPLAIELISTGRAQQAFNELKVFVDEQKHPGAQNMIGDMYFCGIGVAQDFKVAADYYELAAKNGNALSANNLGYAVQYGLKEGQKFTPEPHEAMTHYMQALITTASANKEDTDYMEGILQKLEKKQEFSVEIYDSGQHMNTSSDFLLISPHSYFLQMAISYEYGDHPDLLTAFAILKNACLLQGKKLEASELQTLKDLQEKILASAEEDLKSKNYLSAYKNFFFLAKDSHVTLENQAAALRRLGQMYFKGWGVTQNYKQAINFLHIPAKQGDQKACLLLAEIYSSDTQYFNAELAKQFYEKSSLDSVQMKHKLTALKKSVYHAAMADLEKHAYEKAREKFVFLLTEFKENDEYTAKAQYEVGLIDWHHGRNHSAFLFFEMAENNNYKPADFMKGQALETEELPFMKTQRARTEEVLALYKLASDSDDPSINHQGKASYAIALILSRSDSDEDKLKIKDYLEKAHLQGDEKALPTMILFSDKYANQHSNALISNKVDLHVSNELLHCAAQYGDPTALRIQREKKNIQLQAEQEKKAAEEKLKMEKEQGEKELKGFFSSRSNALSSSVNAFVNWFSPDSGKQSNNPTILDNPSNLKENFNSDEDSGIFDL